MKKISLLLLIIIFVFLFACNSNVSKEEIIPSQTHFNTDQFIEPAEILITLPSRGDIYDKNYVSDWEAYINETFDINIRVEFTFRDMFLVTRSSSKISEGEEGLYYVESFRFNEFIETVLPNDNISNLSPYLKDNEAWNALPEVVRNLYALNDEIYGIPNTFEPALYGRLINEKWITNLEQSLPSNTTELANLLQRFTYDNPNQSETNDTIGLNANSMYDLIDIFNAYGCYVDFSQYSSLGRRPIVSPVAYVQDSQLFTNCMYNEKMVDALTYIKGLYEINVLEVFGYENEAGTLYGKVTDDNKETFLLNTAFTGIDNNKVIAATYADFDAGAYFLSATTKNKEEVVSSFINTFYGNTAGNEIAAYGLPTKDRSLEYPYICEDISLATPDENFLRAQENNKVYYIIPHQTFPFGINNFSYTINEGESMFSSVSMESLFNGVLYDLTIYGNDVKQSIDAYQTIAKKSGMVEFVETLNQSFAD